MNRPPPPAGIPELSLLKLSVMEPPVMFSVPPLLMLMPPPRSSAVLPVMMTSVRFTVVPSSISRAPPLPPQPPVTVPLFKLSTDPVRTTMAWVSRDVHPRSSVKPFISMVIVLLPVICNSASMEMSLANRIWAPSVCTASSNSAWLCTTIVLVAERVAVIL